MKMSFVFKVIAKNPPTALFILAAFMILTGSTSNNQELVTWGQRFFSWGLLLQVLWLALKFRK